MGKQKKATVVQASESQQSSPLPELANKKKQNNTNAASQAKTKPIKKVVQQKEQSQEDTPVQQKKKNVKAPRKESKASVDEQAPVAKNAARKGSVDKVNGKKTMKAKQPSSQEEDQKPQKAQKVVAAQTKKPLKAARESSQESSQKPVKHVAKAAVAQKNKKKQTSSQQQSDEIIAPPKKAPVVQTKSKKDAKQAKVVAKKQSSSEESQQEEKPQPKKVQPKVQAKKQVKKAESSQQESQQQKPKPRKASKEAIKVDTKKKPVKKQTSSEQQEQQKPEPVKKKPVAVAKKQQKKQQSQQQQQSQKPAPKRKSSGDLIKKAPVPVAKKEEHVEQQQQGQYQVAVQGLSFNAFDGDIRDLFSQCGNIINVKMISRPDGKPKGFAFVKFSTKSAFNKALELNGTEHMGRNIRVEQARGNQRQQRPGQGGNNRNNQQPTGNANIETPTLFIGGLSYNSTVDSIKQLFSSIGQVQSARIVTDKQTGKPRGFGYVEFYDVDSAKKAYQQLNGQYLDGRQIRLDSAAQRDRPRDGAGGFGNRQGGGGFRNNDRQGSAVYLSNDDKAAKKGTIAGFAGKKIQL